MLLLLSFRLFLERCIVDFRRADEVAETPPDGFELCQCHATFMELRRQIQGLHGPGGWLVEGVP